MEWESKQGGRTVQTFEGFVLVRLATIPKQVTPNPKAIWESPLKAINWKSKGNPLTQLLTTKSLVVCCLPPKWTVSVFLQLAYCHLVMPFFTFLYVPPAYIKQITKFC